MIKPNQLYGAKEVSSILFIAKEDAEQLIKEISEDSFISGFQIVSNIHLFEHKYPHFKYFKINLGE